MLRVWPAGIHGCDSVWLLIFPRRRRGPKPRPRNLTRRGRSESSSDNNRVPRATSSRDSSREKLTELWGQPVVVENQAGASGTIGAELAAKAPADGYTLLMASHSNLVLARAPAPICGTTRYWISRRSGG